MINYKYILIVILMLLSCYSSPQAVALPIERLSQGDKILTYNQDNKIRKCTIGYVDLTNKSVLTAAHCGKQGERIYTASGTYIGELNHIKDDYDSYDSDIATILIENNNIVLVENQYSNTTMVSRNDVHVGAPVCSYGETSRRISCGEIVRREGNTVYSNIVGTRKGDSGGALWLRDTGDFVGIVSAILPIYKGSSTIVGTISNMIPDDTIQVSHRSTIRDVHNSLRHDHLVENPSDAETIADMIYYYGLKSMKELNIVENM